MLSHPLVSMLTGAVSAGLLISAKFWNLLPLQNREYITEFMFMPAIFALGLGGALFFLKHVHDLLAKERVLGRYEEIQLARRNATISYRLFLDFYSVVGILFMFVAGFLVAHAFLLLVTGQIWVLSQPHRLS